MGLVSVSESVKVSGVVAALSWRWSSSWALGSVQIESEQHSHLHRPVDYSRSVCDVSRTVERSRLARRAACRVLGTCM